MDPLPEGRGRRARRNAAAGTSRRQEATAYVALGANLGDPAATVRAAFGALANLPESRVSRSSSLYRTAPVGLTDQPDFINAVAELQTTLAPEALLDALFDIEQRFGRIRADKNGPRTLDLDLLLYDDQRIDLPHLTLPHPRLHLRAFVLQPLAEIAPQLVIPGRGAVAAWLPAVANQGIVKL
ncbi:MAG: 2-amino-4-hydroxy-6-hydroxymethyldihydropteridine diphosphokinase [Betaproteobacteria bacterium HGW-Betaproteobacteria-4]|nr:MAG: 2-amino-4-hydroxy-6-hydroxymethyldihydropteridine diphosphokinase [Betaproteobacteria bacterium HGW-Betaproteobacteria-4]